MESNGKSVDRDGNRVDYGTGPVLFESRDQRAACLLPVDPPGTRVVLPIPGTGRDPEPHWQTSSILLSNFLAQPEALMRGKTAEEVRAELQGAGVIGEAWKPWFRTGVRGTGRPTRFSSANSIHALCLLIALYEHKVFVQGIIWNINSFDQWGVELGKQLAGDFARIEASAVTA